MKKSTASVFGLLLSLSVLKAEVPQSMNYQAVARNASGGVMAKQPIRLRFTLRDAAANGNILYREIDTATTNQYGLFTTFIGAGVPEIGTFAELQWGVNAKFLQVEMDATGSGEFVEMGTSQLLSVPYALYAEKAGGSMDAGTAAGNTAYWNGSQWVANSSNLYNNGGNIGINTTQPVGKLHIKGDANVAQLVVDANSTQSADQPLIKLRNNAGQDLLWINAPDTGNVFMGIGAGRSTNIAEGKNNTFIGSKAGYSNTTGPGNTGIGCQALYSNYSGSNNTALGNKVLFKNITGYDNTAAGVNAMYNNLAGYNNVAQGISALFSNTFGNDNVGIGNGALYANNTGNYNVAVGTHALAGTFSGENNVAIGNVAGGAQNHGSNNIFIGANSTAFYANLSNVIAIGQGTTVTASNQARIGNTTITSIGSYTDWTNLSDGRYKKNIEENVKGLEFITRLRPVTYNLDVTALDKRLNTNNGETSPERQKAVAEKEQIVYSGFIAQEVEQAAKETGYDFSGVDAPADNSGIYGLRYAQFVTPLVKAVQEQQQQIEELKKANQQMQNEINLLKAGR